MSTRAPEDDGFILLESILSISLIVVVLAGLTTFFVTVSDASSALRGKQAAAVIAGNTIDQVRALQPRDTYAGHSSAAVRTQRDSAPTQVSVWLANMYLASDNSGAAAKLPMTLPDQIINNVRFHTNDYIGTCDVPLSSSDGTACLVDCPQNPPTQDLGSCTPGYAAAIPTAAFIRVVVAVTWFDTHCPSTTCAFLTSTIVSTDSDPDFLLNQSPPNPPLVAAINDRSDAINDAVSLQAALLANTGVNPITWAATNLPAGLTINPMSGLISGTVTGASVAGSTGSLATTVTATDAFNRSDSEPLTWTVLPDLVPSNPGNRTAMITGAISTLTMTATGGSGSGYTFSAPAQGQAGALPPGLAISGVGAITGTPTTAGSYASVITVGDSSGQRTRTRTVNWTILTTPTITGLTNLKVPAGGAVTAVALPYTCTTPSPPNCTFSISGGPSSLGLSATSNGTAAASVTVSAASGTLYLLGSIPTGTTSWPVVLTPRDNTYAVNGATNSATVAATWTQGLAAVTGVHSAAFTTQSLGYSCAKVNCVVTLSLTKNGSAVTTPAWLSKAVTLTSPSTSLTYTTAGTGTLYLGGTLPATAGTYVLTLTIADGSVATIDDTVTSTWTVT